jgi:hypothetical protein
MKSFRHEAYTDEEKRERKEIITPIVVEIMR